MKKLVTMIFLLLLLTFIGVFCASAGDNRKPARIIYGDVNLDGAVNISDAAQIQKYLALYKTDSVLNLINDKNLTDFNGDSIISISNVTALKKHIAGIDSGSMIGATAYILSDSEYLRAVEVSSPDEPVMNHLYVSKSYDKDEACFGEFKFNTILDANESISSNSEKNRYTIHVADGNSNFCAVDGVFFNKDKTKLIRYPEEKTGTGYSIPATVKTVCDSAFYHCSQLTSIEIPSSVRIIEDYGISACDSLERITFPESVNSVGEFSFANNTNLKTVTILAKSPSVESNAFDNSAVKTVHYAGSETEWNASDWKYPSNRSFV